MGRAWMAVREDETVAEAMGINTVNVKLLAFVVGAVLGIVQRRNLLGEGRVGVPERAS